MRGCTSSRSSSRSTGCRSDHIEITDEALLTLITSYTREAGVRDLERRIADCCRAVAVDVAGGKADKQTVTSERVKEILGPESYYSEVAERTEVPGVATGLAWTAVGGDMLFIEATKMTGKGGMTLTGQLGDVMKESAQAALELPAEQGRRPGHQSQLPREDGHPPALPGRRHPQGRALGGRHHPHRAHLAAHRHPRPGRHGHDRRGHAARAGAAGGRHQGEGARRAPGRHQARHPPGARPQGPARTSRSRRRRTSSSSSSPAWTRCWPTPWRPTPSRPRRTWPRPTSPPAPEVRA